MLDESCYKEDSLRDFAKWAVLCGHYSVAPLIKNYQEFLYYAKDRKPEPQTAPIEDDT
jgi:hypothetical protein